MTLWSVQVVVILLAAFAQPSPLRPPPVPAGVQRDRAAESRISNLLLSSLAKAGSHRIHRFDPVLLQQGVCTSAIKGAPVSMMYLEGGPETFYVTTNSSLDSPELQDFLTNAVKAKSMSRYAVSVWKKDANGGSSQYWVRVLLARGAVYTWLNLHMGSEDVGPVWSPNAEAKKAVAAACRRR
jgi:hypothetical protein